MRFRTKSICGRMRTCCGRTRGSSTASAVLQSAWERFSRADTLVYVDLPLVTHYWWVTKRLIKGLWIAPEGWPANSPLWSSTMAGYRVIPLCHREMTPRYRQLVADAAGSKRVHHLRSPTAMTAFLDQVGREHVADECVSTSNKAG